MNESRNNPPSTFEAERRVPAAIEEDTYPAYGPTTRPRRAYVPEPTPRESLLRFTAGAFALTVALWAIAYSIQQVTAPEVALPAHERAIEALTGMEDLLVLHEETIRAEAREASDPNAPIEIPGLFMHDVTLTAAEAGTVSVQDWHDLLSARAARATYEEGLGVFHEDRVIPGASVFSTAGTGTRLLGFISEARHDQFSSLIWPLAATSGVLALLVLIVGPGMLRFKALGIGLLVAAAAVALAGGFALFLTVAEGGDGSHLANEFASITRTLARAPLQNALWIALAGVALTVPALIANRLLGAEPEYTAEEDVGAGYEAH